MSIHGANCNRRQGSNFSHVVHDAIFRVARLIPRRAQDRISMMTFKEYRGAFYRALGAGSVWLILGFVVAVFAQNPPQPSQPIGPGVPANIVPFGGIAVG